MAPVGTFLGLDHRVGAVHSDDLVPFSARERLSDQKGRQPRCRGGVLEQVARRKREALPSVSLSFARTCRHWPGSTGKGYSAGSTGTTRAGYWRATLQRDNRRDPLAVCSGGIPRCTAGLSAAASTAFAESLTCLPSPGRSNLDANDRCESLRQACETVKLLAESRAFPPGPDL